MSDIKLYNGDCFEIMKYLIAREIQVDAVICDPPYNIFQANWDENFDIKSAIALTKQLTKPNSNIINSKVGLMFVKQKLLWTNTIPYRTGLFMIESKVVVAKNI